MTDGGYLGMSHIENRKVNACGLFRLNKKLDITRETAIEVYLEHCGLHNLLERVQNAERDDESCIAVNAFEFGIQPGNEQSTELCIGDRFSVIGPFTGHGMSLAFESALISGNWIEKYANGSVNWKEVTAGAAAEMKYAFRRRLLMSSALHPFLTTNSGRRIFATLGRAGVLPFGLALRLVR